MSRELTTLINSGKRSTTGSHAWDLTDEQKETLDKLEDRPICSLEGAIGDV